jgi:hypothetical protein
MGLEKFLEADETYLSKNEAIDYLIKKFNVVPHIARVAVSNATLGSLKNMISDGGMDDLAEYELTVTELDLLGQQLQTSDEDTILNQITQKRKVVKKGDVYAVGYDGELMMDWNDTQIMSHVFFMKFLAPFNNSNVWVYEEIRLSKDLKYTSVTKERTTYPITETFVETYRKIDDFGGWMKKAKEAFEKDQANMIKNQEMGNLEKALAMKKTDENKPLEVFEMIKEYLVRGTVDPKEINKAYKEMKNE